MEALAGYDSDENNLNTTKAKRNTVSSETTGPKDLQAEWENFEKMLGGSAFEDEANNVKKVPPPVPVPEMTETCKEPVDMEISEDESDNSSKNEKPGDKSDSSDSDDSDDSDKQKDDSSDSDSDDDSDDSAKSDSDSHSSDSDASSQASSKAHSPIPERKSRSKSKSPARLKEAEVLAEKLPTEKNERSNRISTERKETERRKSESSRDRSKDRRRRSRSRERRLSSPGRSSHRSDRNRRRRRSSSRDRKRRHRSPRRHRSRDKRRRHSRDRKHRSRSRDRHRHRSRRSSSRGRHRRSHKSRSRSRGRTRPRPRSRSPLVLDKRKENKKLNFKEQLKQSLLSVQKQAHEGKLDLSKLDADGKQLSQREKPSDLPLNASNPLVAMASTGDKVTPQMALLQTMAAMHQKAQQITGIAVPKYYNPAAVNPLKYAEQIQKRKLLWSKNKAEPKEEAKPYNGLKFQTDSDGKTTEKFRKLMGIKQEGAPGTSGEPELDQAALETLQKQEELFRNLDKEYDFARTHTHTQRGMGLGFGSHNVPVPIEQLKAQQSKPPANPTN